MDRKKWFGTLIVVSPTKLRPFKFRFTSKAFLALMVASVICFLLVGVIGNTVRTLAHNLDRGRLAEENQQLKVMIKNAAIGGVLLSDRVSRIEQRARQIEELLEEHQSPDTPEEGAANGAN